MLFIGASIVFVLEVLFVRSLCCQNGCHFFTSTEFTESLLVVDSVCCCCWLYKCSGHSFMCMSS